MSEVLEQLRVLLVVTDEAQTKLTLLVPTPAIDFVISAQGKKMLSAASDLRYSPL
jgi:hypothetical protein